MRTRLFVLALALLLAPATAGAQNREHLQFTADLRMIQEQVSRLQLANNQLAEQLKATNKRLDDLSDANVKAFANQKVALDQALTSLSTVREKLQDSDVRVSQLTQEMNAIRDGLRMLTDQINSLVGLLQPPAAAAVTPGGATPPATPTAPAGEGTAAAAPPTGPLAPITLQPSAGRIYTQGLNDYMSGRLDSAIEGFREVIQKYPTSPSAADAQFQIGESLYQQGKCREAIPEYQKLIANYKTSDHIAEAYYMQGVCYTDLNQRTNAQHMFETVVKQYPGTTQAIMAQQKLQQR